MQMFTAELRKYGFLINLLPFQVLLALLENQKYQMSPRTLPLLAGKGQLMMVAVRSQDIM